MAEGIGKTESLTPTMKVVENPSLIKIRTITHQRIQGLTEKRTPEDIAVLDPAGHPVRWRDDIMLMGCYGAGIVMVDTLSGLVANDGKANVAKRVFRVPTQLWVDVMVDMLIRIAPYPTIETAREVAVWAMNDLPQIFVD